MPRTPGQWLDEIESAFRREKEWRKDVKRVKAIYDGCKRAEVPYNILYSNTEMLLPALYSATPRPQVERRFKDADALGKAAAEVGQRLLEFSLDSNDEAYPSFDGTMEEVVLDCILAGRGNLRIRYDAEIANSSVVSECVSYESLAFDRWVYGFAKKWEFVPWIAFLHNVTKEEALSLFPPDLVEKLSFEVDREEEDERQKEREDSTKTAQVYEVWDREGGRMVRYVGMGVRENFLREEEDPLELEGFFPVPKPLFFLAKSNDLAPTVPYVLYEAQAEELNRITRRINRVVEALKVRGAYDSSLSEIAGVFDDAEDNKLIPVDNVAALQDKGLDKAIWLVPLEKLVTVLSQLLVAREQCKVVIFEITGISDVLRGSTKASETLGAQKLKSEWGSLRLKRLQNRVQGFVRESLRIALEIAATKFNQRTIVSMSGLSFPTDGEKLLASIGGQTLDPRLPTWEQIRTALSDDVTRNYKIDVETNSTVDLEATEDQRHISELMNAMAQFLNGIAPLVQAKALPIEAAKSMLLMIVRRYRLGSDVEKHIEAMQMPQEGNDSGEQETKAIDLETKKLEFQARQAEMAMEAELAKAEHARKMQESYAKAAYAEKLSVLKLAEMEAKLRLVHAQGGKTGAVV